MFILEVAYDSQRDTLYWTVIGNPIQLQQLSPGSNVSLNLVKVNSTAGIAVDYIGQRMCWVEGSTLVCIYSEVTNSTMTICDWACENRAYLHIKFSFIFELQLLISFEIHKL